MESRVPLNQLTHTTKPMNESLCVQRECTTTTTYSNASFLALSLFLCGFGCDQWSKPATSKKRKANNPLRTTKQLELFSVWNFLSLCNFWSILLSFCVMWNISVRLTKLRVIRPEFFFQIERFKLLSVITKYKKSWK